MKLRLHTAFVASVVLLSLFWASFASAQQVGMPYQPPYPMQPPLFAPRKTPLCGGLFYIAAGAMARRLQVVQFELIASEAPGFGAVAAFGLAKQQLGNEVWSPAIEAGYTAGDFFDLFTRFSWYNVDGSAHRVLSGVVTQDECDTYPSTNTCVAGDYTLDVDYALKFDVYEFRTGGRSWVPLYGLGRFGVSLGLVTAYVPYWVKAVEVQNGPYNNTDDPVVLPSTISRFGYHADNWFYIGGFGGLELEAGINRFFAKVALEGSLGWPLTYNGLLNIETVVNPSVISIFIAGGIRF